MAKELNVEIPSKIYWILKKKIKYKVIRVLDVSVKWSS